MINNYVDNNNLGKIIIGLLLSTLLLCFFYYSITDRIYIYEFDSIVALISIESLITSGKATIPIVEGGTYSFCNLSNVCSNLQDFTYGQNTKGQWSANITSGLVMLFPAKILHQVLKFFSLSSNSISYLLSLYSLSTGLLVSILILLANSQSKFSFFKKLTVWIIPVPIVCSILLISGDRIVGEFISSILISISIFILILSYDRKQSSSFYSVIALIIGLSFEAKSTVGIVALITYLFLCFQSWSVEKSLKKLFIYGFIAATPKLLFFIYVFGIVNFSFEGFLKYLDIYGIVAAHNASAFLKWEVPNLYSGVMFYGFDVIYKKIYIAILAALITIFTVFILIKKDYKNLLIPFFIIIIIFSTLIYPIIFSSPYPRIFSFFWATLIATLLGLFLRLDLLSVFYTAEQTATEYSRLRKAKYDLLNQNEMRYDDVKNSTTTWVDAIDAIKAAHPKPDRGLWRASPSGIITKKSNINILNYIFIFISLIIFFIFSPFSAAGLKDEIFVDREFEKQYPEIDIKSNTKFITPGVNAFFAFPWDYYLGRRLNNEITPLFYNSLVINPPNDFYNNTYLISTCRWGHCNRSDIITVNMSLFEKKSQLLTCKFIEPTNKNENGLRLYKCTE